MPVLTWALVFIGGGLGSLCRFALSVYNQNLWPWGTLITNSLSCLILGFGTYLIAQEVLPRSGAPFLLVGFCGGFSTFSTFSNELLIGLQAGELEKTFIYLLVSLATGFLGILLGLYLGKFCL